MYGKTSERDETENGLTLKDMIANTNLERLKQLQKTLTIEIERKKQEKLEREREERKKRENNMTFEELLNESELNWKDFK
jgi:trehalose/maltose hydrolase-like predicted phosphorylase